MRQRIAILAIALALFQGACGDAKKSKPDATGRVGGGGDGRGTGLDGTVVGGTPPGTPGQADAVWGKITPIAGQVTFANGQTENTDIHTMARWFLSTDLPLNKVGSTAYGITSGDPQQLECGRPQSPYGPLNSNCAIGFSSADSSKQPTLRFDGNKMLNDAIATPSGINLTSGKMSIVVWDSLSGIGNFTPLTMTLNLSQRQRSFVSGNCQQDFCQPGQSQVDIYLEDNYGAVRLTGTIVGNQLQLTSVSFANSSNRADNRGGARAVLGQGLINPCKFMPCR